jgi:hypothetical protein
MKSLKNSLRLEEIAFFTIALLALKQLDYSWGIILLFFFAPDLGALGYLINPRLGSFTYNLVHHKGTAIAAYLIGLQLANPAIQFAGLILFAHSSFDRAIGYGLKLPGTFDQTHLGPIGKAAKSSSKS